MKKHNEMYVQLSEKLDNNSSVKMIIGFIIVWATSFHYVNFFWDRVTGSIAFVHSIVYVGLNCFWVEWGDVLFV